ncbi:MAG: SLC13 family permease [Anaerolineales bacterium]
MALEQGLVYGVIAVTLIMLAFEVWRYDVAALIGMLLLTLLGTITVEEAFAGFGHPAVVTIAAVLVVSHGLQNTGAVDHVAKWMSAVGDRLGTQLMALCGVVTLSSAFMNNIAALAIFIPVAVRIARRSDRPPSLYLLPMAFSAHLGGFITLIGEPTNLIMSELRLQYVGERFGMFAFAPIGLAISVVGITFIAAIGWHLIPQREEGGGTENGFATVDYLTEIEVSPQSQLVGTRLRDLDSATDANIWVATILREDERISSPSGSDRIEAGDILLVWADPEDLREFIYETGAKLTESKPLEGNGEEPEPQSLWEQLRTRVQSEDAATVEAVVSPDSILARKTARFLDLRSRYGVNLLAISRCNEHLRTQVGRTVVQPGDVLLLQVRPERIPEVMERLGCMPLAERELALEPRNLLLGTGIFLTALATSSLGILSVPVAMMSAAVAMIISGVVPLREVYRHIEWPIIVLLGAMLSMGAAMEQTGGSQLIADQILRASGIVPPVVLLIVIMLVTMMLSDIVNNAASVVLMASIAVSVAKGLGVSIDPFLVAVAIGGTCAFLTPIGHEANVLVFEPGGYEFADYWHLGLPLELLITAITVPLLLLLWPL